MGTLFMGNWRRILIYGLSSGNSLSSVAALPLHDPTRWGVWNKIKHTTLIVTDGQPHGNDSGITFILFCMTSHRIFSTGPSIRFIRFVSTHPSFTTFFELLSCCFSCGFRVLFDTQMSQTGQVDCPCNLRNSPAKPFPRLLGESVVEGLNQRLVSWWTNHLQH